MHGGEHCADAEDVGPLAPQVRDSTVVTITSASGFMLRVNDETGTWRIPSATSPSVYAPGTLNPRCRAEVAHGGELRI